MKPESDLVNADRVRMTLSEFSKAELLELCLAQALLLARRIQAGVPSDARSFENLARVHANVARAGDR
jgi:hypothetical protein